MRRYFVEGEFDEFYTPADDINMYLYDEEEEGENEGEDEEDD